MVRKTEREQLNRLTVETLDQVFIARAKEGLNCSSFEAQALTDLVEEVYFPWLSRPEAIHAGQLILTAVSADEPGHKWITTSSISPASTSLPFSAGWLSLRLPSPSNDHATWSRSTLG